MGDCSVACLCRALQRWASASADFARRHNPVHPVAQSRSLARIKDWRPFKGHRDTLYLDQCTSAKSEDWADTSSSEKSEGRVGQLVMYLMPQVLFVAIFRKAQQVRQHLVYAALLDQLDCPKRGSTDLLQTLSLCSLHPPWTWASAQDLNRGEINLSTSAAVWHFGGNAI